MVIVGAGNEILSIIQPDWQAFAFFLLGVLASSFHHQTVQNAGATN
jgi:hypothetical protein